ncbi:MAG TPA: tetratricopeptide repeat protein [Drouetiella sp.]
MAGISKEERQQLLRSIKTADDNFKRGMYALAEPTYRRALEVLGDGTAEICDCIQNLAQICIERKDLNDALKLRIRLLLLFEERFGGDHVKTISLMDDIASLYEQLGRTDESRDMYERARKASERSLWADQQNEGDILDDSVPAVGAGLSQDFQYSETAKSALETDDSDIVEYDFDSTPSTPSRARDAVEETMKLPKVTDDMVPPQPPKDPQLETLILDRKDLVLPTFAENKAGNGIAPPVESPQDGDGKADLADSIVTRTKAPVSESVSASPTVSKSDLPAAKPVSESSENNKSESSAIKPVPDSPSNNEAASPAGKPFPASTSSSKSDSPAVKPFPASTSSSKSDSPVAKPASVSPAISQSGLAAAMPAPVSSASDPIIATEPEPAAEIVNAPVVKAPLTNPNKSQSGLPASAPEVEPEWKTYSGVMKRPTVLREGEDHSAEESTELVPLDKKSIEQAAKNKPPASAKAASEDGDKKAVSVNLFQSKRQRNIIISIIIGCFALLVLASLFTGHGNPQEDFRSMPHRYRTVDGEKLFFLSTPSECEMVAGSETAKMHYSKYQADFKDTFALLFGPITQHQLSLTKNKAD